MSRRIIIVCLALAIALTGCSSNKTEKIKEGTRADIFVPDTTKIDNKNKEEYQKLNTFISQDDRAKVNDTYLKNIHNIENEEIKNEFRIVVYNYYVDKTLEYFDHFNKTGDSKKINEYLIGYIPLQMEWELPITMEDVEAIEKSKKEFEAAESLMGGLRYEEAIPYYEKVIQLDINYSMARANIQRCKELIVERDNNSVTKLIESKKYEEALNLAEKLYNKDKELYGDLFKRTKDTYTELKVKAEVEGCITKDFDEKNFVELEKHYNDLKDKYPSDSAIDRFGNKVKDEQAAYEADYINSMKSMFNLVINSNETDYTIENMVDDINEEGITFDNYDYIESQLESLRANIEATSKELYKTKCNTTRTAKAYDSLESLVSDIENSVIDLSVQLKNFYNSSYDETDIIPEAVNFVVNMGDKIDKMKELQNSLNP